ncbi:undecaprenyldiphospho-muramoylpentapeptide beta-N-acetylglucosaminyltransferase [Aquisalinus flavus]|uniref:UDP-N-acetylglucosamine--N-acetylmuramyl-(pentapeptide) pyrophosphoryl-undecaprenol N-acetylglucosamine transferase n=1 Tax=Aquisalinus flavus TaxID=1526572 RepID=A0A8J2V4S3_9PROT|nr:undecaprenyldiphospho-muramoylpentapeptide beta-N-acetylglucosaminyltransferase [Aquisalinus flavus]MBD0427295.1 undecaprenyldiphospho-muramoylpentapeptide beta-N-acetylglucosaminyltransferase [Aquisalinus flavus]UNE47104.1 undecaprenyldiphospho-muramoylpentapeptide beta-N-acetylglucosaminyltransferase [Aquisalinus flavus]GGC99854.1 UDP-N-acetylglucosamine--N-acetylmuramyl-(pentapeptide) pyrophosphoryl-undecaprenol N-acetylglucosamine transferase [Aquisalinus flavus]
MVDIEGRRALIALAAGGTGGHMFPAEALAEEMKRRGWRVLLFTDDRGMRFGDSFPADEIVTLQAANPNVPGARAKVGAAFAMTGGIITALQAYRRHKPSIAVGFGGYPSAPAMAGARIMKVPYGVHEQNAVIGRVNRLVAPQARFVAHAFPMLERLPARVRGEVIETGNPVRDAIRAVAGSPYPDASDRLNLLVFGGSQGASLFSRIVPDALAALPAELRQRISVTQQVRDEEKDQVAATYQGAGIEADLAPFFKDIPARLTAAHLVIARAGASSVTELATVGRPSILVPLGIAMDDHQTGNASVLVAAGGADMIPERQFDANVLSARLGELLTDPGRLAQMAAAASTIAPDQAVSRLADIVTRLAR